MAEIKQVQRTTAEPRNVWSVPKISGAATASLFLLSALGIVLTW